MSEWQPIETAPKDGTRILTASRHNSGWWLIVAEWGGKSPPRWIDSFIGRTAQSPTHWMPLPEPPQ